MTWLLRLHRTLLISMVLGEFFGLDFQYRYWAHAVSPFFPCNTPVQP